MCLYNVGDGKDDIRKTSSRQKNYSWKIRLVEGEEKYEFLPRLLIASFATEHLPATLISINE